jgi:4-diphosphocytidyl-2-C-methyl-D-erythritol kinase
MTIQMPTVQVLAPAKINLSLLVLGRRSDGFHDLETTITSVSLADVLEVEKQPRWIDFSCDDPALPSGEDNLVVRAAKAFFEATRIQSGVAIKLQKRIPHGAGLGGGSSDAASILLALNALFETQLPREALAKMAATIGSDVPFFIFESAAICRGRGEIVLPFEFHRRIPLLLLKPAFAVATAWAYSRWQRSREIPGVSYVSQTFAGLSLVNDLERAVFEKFVFLAELKGWLLRQPEVGAALMSGSGSTMFAVLRENADADLLGQRARAELDPKLWTCACQTR